MPKTTKAASTHPPTVGPFAFTAELWLYQGKGAWHFVSVPVELGEEIRARTALHRRGWGSVKVAATVGASKWETSLFPEKKTGSFLLPVKESVRTAEALAVGTLVPVSLDVYL